VSGTRLYTPAFWLACAIHFTGGMSVAMFLLFPLFVRSLGGDELAIGGLLGLGMASSVATRPLVGLVLDRLGRRGVLLVAGALNALLCPPFVAVRTVGPALAVLATAHFVVAGALFAAYFTYAADLVPATRRVEGIAIFGIAGIAPNGLGPALGEAIIARSGYALFFLVAAGFATLSTLLSGLAREAPRTTAVSSGLGRGVGDVLLRGGLGRILLATAIFGAGSDAAFFYVAPYTRDLGIERAAPFFAAYATMTIVVRLVGRRLPDRVGPHAFAIPFFAVFAIGLTTLMFLPHPGILVAAGIACGAGHGTLFPVLNGIAVGRTPPRHHGMVVSLYTAALDTGAVLGLPLCGVIAHAAGYRTMFGTMALAAVAGLVLVRIDARAEHLRLS